MSVLCNVTCPSSADPVPYCDPCDINKQRYGQTYFGLIKCNYQFTDILDTAEWGLALTTGDVVISPAGILDLPTPSQSSFQITGCGLRASGVKTYTLEYRTYCMAADLSDYAFYSVLDESYTAWRMFWWDCIDGYHFETNWVDAIALGAPATVAGSNPGFEFSVSETPHKEEGEESLAIWKTVFEIEVSSMIEAALVPGLSAVLVS